MMKDRELELNFPHILIVFHVTLTNIDSYCCDSRCLVRLFQNLPAPPKHYSVFEVFATAKKLGSH